MAVRTLVTAARSCAILLVLSGAAHATSPQRTFVASSGNDANPCSLTLPCRGFTAAVAAVATAGEVVVLDTAGYGSFTITKSVSVIAPSGIYAGISVFTATDGVIINAPGGTVALRGLVINGQGGNRGIVVTDAASVSIDYCTVSSVGNVGIQIDGGGDVRVADSIIRDTGDSGFLVNNGTVQLNRVQVRGTANNGIDLENGTMSVRDSVVTKTGAVGILALANPGKTANLTVERTTITETAFEGVFASGNGGTATAVAIDNVLTDGQLFSGLVVGGVTSTMRATGNTVTRYAGSGLLNSGSALFESQGNNFVQGNTGGTTSGSITIVGTH